MRIRRVSVRNYRGIRQMDWNIEESITCLIGPGDSTKSTILDAIELALSPRWNVTFDDSDFHNADTSQDIEITVTVGDLPDALITEQKFGLHKRGWKADTGLMDEPEDNCDEVLSVQLRVDSSLEPEWKIINDRDTEGRTISSRDREKLGVVRIGTYVNQHFAWTRTSTLARLTDNQDDAAAMVTNANREARRAADLSNIDAFKTIIERASDNVSKLGVKPAATYAAKIDPRMMNSGLGTITIHDGDVPLRLAGLGSKRLFAFGLQLMHFDNGAILLVDELEHALEPFRIRNLLRKLQDFVTSEESSITQVIVTSHSPTTLVELAAQNLAVVRSDGGITSVPHVSAELQSTVRKVPEALLARKVIVCEGKTEYGICLALDAHCAQEDLTPFSCEGVALIEGGGRESPKRALALKRLGYETCLFIDSDRLADLEPELGQFREIGGTVICWDGECASERRIVSDLPLDSLNAFLELGAECLSSAKDLEVIEAQRIIIDQIASNLATTTNNRTLDIASWLDQNVNEGQLRSAIGDSAKSNKNSWFKRIDLAERLGQFVIARIPTMEETNTSRKLMSLKDWVYGTE